MVSGPVLFDTNILIDYLRGIPQARAECERYADRAISMVTWMEVMAGSSEDNEIELREFLLNFITMPLTQAVAERAVMIRRSRKIKLPDAVIQATAEESGRLLVTRNTRDFNAKMAGVRIPYSVG
jgi:hypothetical protein